MFHLDNNNNNNDKNDSNNNITQTELTVEDTINLAIIGLERYVSNSNERLLTAAVSKCKMQ